MKVCKNYCDGCEEELIEGVDDGEMVEVGGKNILLKQKLLCKACIIKLNSILGG